MQSFCEPGRGAAENGWSAIANDFLKSVENLRNLYVSGNLTVSDQGNTPPINGRVTSPRCQGPGRVEGIHP